MESSPAPVRFAVLGPLRACRGGRDLPLGPAQRQAVLLRMLAAGGRGTTVEQLVDAVWGEHPPGSAVTAVRTHVFRLRQILEEVPQSPSLLVTTQGAYALRGAAGTDEDQARSLAGLAARERDHGDPARAAELLRQALDLWQGAPVAGVPGPFARLERGRLTELELSLREERLALLVGMGERTAVEDLTRLVAEHPLRERPRELLMLALYQGGRQAEALSVYRETHRLLGEELGVQPGRGLQEMHLRILHGTAGARPGAAVDSPTERDTTAPVAPVTPVAPVVPAVPWQAPAAPADFTGRAEELCWITAALASPGPRIVLHGMGGVGKSTLALRAAAAVADRFPDGILHAELRGIDGPVEPSTVLEGWLLSLGVPPSRIPVGLADRSALLRTHLYGRRLLVLADNATDAAHVAPLLPGHGEAAVIITSRAPLAGLPASHRLSVEPLPAADAHQLIARIVGGERTANEPEATTALGRVCGNLPLALRISASRLAVRPRWSIESMVERLADSTRMFGELCSGDLAVSSAFATSFAQLPDQHARALVTLATVNTTQWSVRVAAAVLGRDEPATERLLEDLADAALLQARTPGTYAFHELVGAYARDKATELLTPQDLRDAIHGAVAILCAALCATVDACYREASVLATNRLCDAHSVAALGTSWGEAATWLRPQSPVLASVLNRAADTGDARTITMAMTILARLPILEDYLSLAPFSTAAHRLADAADSLYQEHGSKRTDGIDTAVLRAGGHFNVGVIAASAGDMITAQARLGHALDLLGAAAFPGHVCQDDHPPIDHACAAPVGGLAHIYAVHVLFILAEVLHQTGDYQRARCSIRRSITLLALREGTSVGLERGHLLRLLIDVSDPNTHLDEHHVLARAHRFATLFEHDETRAWLTAALLEADTLRRAGRHRQAADRYLDIIERIDAKNMFQGTIPVRYRLAQALAALGHTPEAIGHARQALNDANLSGDRHYQARATLVLAVVLEHDGQDATPFMDTAAQTYQELGLPFEQDRLDISRSTNPPTPELRQLEQEPFAYRGVSPLTQGYLGLSSIGTGEWAGGA
ncbi:BTAD domain-containing putative transcriptional regulator [Kitasatospora sp. NPDC086801]|uniref:AfsR/SARP family transcriptional regulator n=1 Tax=Kitasatospora sp. NPDC086801 TaxID=3364066 RepID=UPI0038260DA2